MKTPPREVLTKLPPGTGVNPASLAQAGGAAVDLAALLGPDPLEAEFQAAVVQIAERAGWACYHVPDSRRATATGYPDLTCKRNRGGRRRVLVAELKRRGEKPRPDQRDWLEAFEECGAEAYFWTPDSLDTIREVLK